MKPDKELEEAREEIKRYDLSCRYTGCNYGVGEYEWNIQERGDGSYVKYRDWISERAKVKRLEKERDEMLAYFKGFIPFQDDKNEETKMNAVEVDAMITERIVLFYNSLIERGQIKHVDAESPRFLITLGGRVADGQSTKSIHS